VEERPRRQAHGRKQQTTKNTKLNQATRKRPKKMRGRENSQRKVEADEDQVRRRRDVKDVSGEEEER